jgi:hypothetical protein
LLAGDRQRETGVAKARNPLQSGVFCSQVVVSCPAWCWLHEWGACIVCV